MKNEENRRYKVGKKQKWTSGVPRATLASIGNTHETTFWKKHKKTVKNIKFQKSGRGGHPSSTQLGGNQSEPSVRNYVST
jgi:hypothetical protein